MFAEDLREQLKANHMTQNDLADLVGCCNQAVSSWTTGRYFPREDTLRIVTDLLDMPFAKYKRELRKKPNKRGSNNTSNGLVMSDFDKEKLKKERINRKLDRRQLANLVGVTESTIKNWEIGKVRPSIKNLELLSNVFNVKVKYWEKEKEYGAFEPKVYVDPDVKKKVDLSKNPYKGAQKPLESFKSVAEKKKENVITAKAEKEEKKEEPFRCDMEIKKLKDDYEFLDCRFREFTKVVGKDIDSLIDEIAKKDQKIDELEEKITYLRGMIDGAYTDKPDLESKSWWQRLWS